MSLPENTLSTKTVSGPFKGARNRSDISAMVDWEDGGIDIGDVSGGLEYRAWKCRVVSPNIVITPEISPGVLGDDIALFTVGPDLTECSLTFDQNMNPVVAFVDAGVAKLRWYNTNTSSWIINLLPTGSFSPRVSLDDKRTSQLGNSDVIVAYILNNRIRYRQQRDNYSIEYTMPSEIDIVKPLLKIGMNTELRFQFRTID